MPVMGSLFNCVLSSHPAHVPMEEKVHIQDDRPLGHLHQAQQGAEDQEGTTCQEGTSHSH